MKAAALYARVSTMQQEQEATIDSQVASIEQFAQQQGYELAPEWYFLDQGVSGAKLARPSLDRLRDLATEGVFGVSVLASHQSSVARHGAAAGVPKFIDEHCDVGREQCRSPMILGALSHLDCRLADVFDGGVHAMILGEVRLVIHADAMATLSPLVYFDGAFHGLGERVTD